MAVIATPEQVRQFNKDAVEGGMRILRSTPRLRQQLADQLQKQRDEHEAYYARHIKELDDELKRVMASRAKHPLLCPPFVKEK